MAAPALELLGIRKSFGGVRALDGASLTVFPGEVHALVGENGAGKTTLVSIAAGGIRRDGGVVAVNGIPRAEDDPRQARAAGVVLVPQHDLLVPGATVADNLALLDPRSPRLSTPADRRRLVARAEEALGLPLPPAEDRAARLGVGTRQGVAVAAALLHDPAVLILDEPTSVLAPDESAALFRALRARAARGRAVVVITHRLAEVFAAADRVTLLSAGRTRLESRVSGTDADAVAALLLGDAPPPPREAAPASAVDSAGEALLAEDLRPAGSAAPPLSLRLVRGEVTTILAVEGNGASEIAAALAGTLGRSGRVAVSGRVVPAGDTGAFRAAGGAYVPGDRVAEGIVRELSVAENLALADPERPVFLSRRALERRAREALQRFGIVAGGPWTSAGTLSGGNQQKLLLARELSRQPRLIVAVHPTRGLDPGASGDIRRRLASARGAGAALLLVTADPDEARAAGGAIRVAFRGALSPALPPDTPVDVLGRWLSGVAA